MTHRCFHEHWHCWRWPVVMPFRVCKMKECEWPLATQYLAWHDEVRCESIDTDSPHHGMPLNYWKCFRVVHSTVKILFTNSYQTSEVPRLTLRQRWHVGCTELRVRQTPRRRCRCICVIFYLAFRLPRTPPPSPPLNYTCRERNSFVDEHYTWVNCCRLTLPLLRMQFRIS